MNWKALMHTYKTEGPEATKRALMVSTMKRLKQLAENRCVIQPYQRASYAGIEKKLDLIAKILPYIKSDLEAEENPSESALRRRFLNEGLRILFQQFRAAYPKAKVDDFWYLIQNSVPAQRWDNGKFAPAAALAQPKAWENKQSKPLTTISVEDVKQGRWKPIEKIDGANLKKILYL